MNSEEQAQRAGALLYHLSKRVGIGTVILRFDKHVAVYDWGFQIKDEPWRITHVTPMPDFQRVNAKDLAEIIYHEWGRKVDAEWQGRQAEASGREEVRGRLREDLRQDDDQPLQARPRPPLRR